jgi:preprotein translocase subunit SecG
MMTLIAVIHIIVAIALVGLVLIQDSKGGGALGIGGGAGSNSLLGATGAQSLAAKATRWMAVIFALTCISLTVITARQSRSVLDTGGALPAAAPADPAAATETAPLIPPATEGASPAAAPVDPVQEPKK